MLSFNNNSKLRLIVVVVVAWAATLAVFGSQ